MESLKNLYFLTFPVLSHMDKEICLSDLELRLQKTGWVNLCDKE